MYLHFHDPSIVQAFNPSKKNIYIFKLPQSFNRSIIQTKYISIKNCIIHQPITLSIIPKNVQLYLSFHNPSIIQTRILVSKISEAINRSIFQLFKTLLYYFIFQCLTKNVYSKFHNRSIFQSFNPSKK